MPAKNIADDETRETSEAGAGPGEGDVFVFPASSGQQRLWSLYQLDPGSAVYNLPCVYRLRGSLNIDALTRSLNEIASRHESLRTTFASQDGALVQVIAATAALPCPVVEVAKCVDPEAELRRLLAEEVRRPFDLASGPLFRPTVFRVSLDDHVLVLNVHHIAWDGWSQAVLFRELRSLYRAFSEGEPAALPEPELQYADYATWQREWLDGEEAGQQLKYWTTQLAGAPSVLNLPADRARPTAQSFRGAQAPIALAPDLVERLRAMSRRHGVTLFMTLMAGLQALLARYVRPDERDIVVGTPIAGRTRPELEGVVGFFANTLAIRSDLSDNPSFAGLLDRVRVASLAAYAHQDLPFERVVAGLNPERTLSHAPIFQVMLVLREDVPDLALPGLDVTEIVADAGVAKFDASVWLGATAEGALRGFVEYSTDLFDRQTIDRMVGHLGELLDAAAQNPDTKVEDLPILPEAERCQVLVEWNDTAGDYPRAATMPQVFADQARRTPDAPAVSCRGERWSYQELDERAEWIARRLHRAGARPETIVGVCMQRSLDLVAAMLGILKSGAAYLPLDPAYPRDRLAAMIDDSQPLLVLSDQGTSERLSDIGVRTVCVDVPGEHWPVGPALHEGAFGPAPENVAYVIYTSGSTGKPKGVMVEHRNVMNYFAALDRVLGERVGTWLAVTSVSFDPAVEDLWWPLMRGGEVVVWPGMQHDDVSSIPDIIRTRHITHLIGVPSFLRMVMAVPGATEALASLEVVVAGGEVLTPALIRDLEPSTSRRIINHYGPTECTVAATTWEVEPDATSIPIGRPLLNTQIYVLDPHRQPVPIGVVGEMYIGGANVARGYLNRAELTADRFVPNPFAAGRNERMYRTGDLARYRADGLLEYVGRIDDQVKIRGFRIELGEIESVLATHESVKQVAVVVREDEPGDKHLAAYVVAAPGRSVAEPELRQHLRSKLPEHMVPRHFVTLDAFPITQNGKVDRKRLPAPDRGAAREGRVVAAPTTPAERLLAGIWAEVLGVAEVGADDNFFELGGDSILAIQIAVRARQSGLNLAPRHFFEHQTVRQLAAAAATERQPTAASGGEVAAGPFPPTPIQAWFFDRELRDSHHWNQAFVFELKERVDVGALESAFRSVLSHHDALRLRFGRDDGGWRQEYVDGATSFRISREDLSHLPPSEQPGAITGRAALLQATLNPGDGRLVCAAHFDLGVGSPARLLIAVHHLAVDGVSWRVLLEDLESAYRQAQRGGAIELPEKTTSFKEWAARLREYVTSDALRAEAEYWRALPAPAGPVLPPDVPGDGPNDEASAQTIVVKLPPDATDALLHRVPAVYRTQINDVLLAALAVAFRRRTGATSLPVHLEGHGREALWNDVDVSRTIGWFTSLFPVTLQVPGDAPDDALLAIRDQLLRIPNRGVGFGILRYLSADHAVANDLSRHDHPEVTFNYFGQLDQVLAGSSLFAFARESAGPVHGASASRAAALEVNALVSGGCLELHWSFSRRRHRPETVERLADEYSRTLHEMVGHCLDGDARRLTPSDFPSAGLNQEALDELLAGLDD